jgi:hypothetical protein
LIDFEKLKNEYQKELGYDLVMEDGEAVDFYRQKNEIVKPVCGIYRVSPITLTAIKRPFIGVATVTVELLASPDKWEEARDKMNLTASTLNGTSIKQVGEHGEVYSISYNCQTCTVADRILDVSLGCGEVFHLTQTISYIIIESGVSAYDAKLTIDGFPVPILSLVENKVHTSSMYATESGDGKTASEQETFGIDFTTPYTTDEVCGIFSDAVNEKSGNTAHCVVIEKNGKKSCYIMSFANVSDSISPPQNIGFNVSMTEVHPMIAVYDGYWIEEICKDQIGKVYSDNLLKVGCNGATVFWGDGASDDLDDLGIDLYHVYSDGKQIHKIRCFKKYNSRLVQYEEGMKFDLLGKYITFRTGGEKLYAENYKDNLLSDAALGSNSALHVSNNRFYMGVGESNFAIGADDERGNYIYDGMRVQSTMKSPSEASELIKEYIYIDRSDIVSYPATEATEG